MEHPMEHQMEHPMEHQIDHQMDHQIDHQMGNQMGNQMGQQMEESADIWNESMSIRFLKKLESYPCLWNRGSKNFTNPASKAAALYKLSRHMNLPGCGAELMQRKVLELKAAFTKEKRRMYEVRRDGGEFVPRYRWYKIADSFWGKIIRIRRLSFYSGEEENPVSSTVPSPQPIPNNDAVNNTVQPPKPVTTSSNEFDAFGKCVALQLKKMPPVAAYELHAEIQAIISKKKLKTLTKTFLRTQCAPCNLSNPLYNITAPSDKCSYTDLRMPFNVPGSNVPWNAPAPSPQYNAPGYGVQYTVPGAGVACNLTGSSEPMVWLRTGQNTFEGYR